MNEKMVTDAHVRETFLSDHPEATLAVTVSPREGGARAPLQWEAPVTPWVPHVAPCTHCPHVQTGFPHQIDPGFPTAQSQTPGSLKQF